MLAIEQKYVSETYDKIAEHFNVTRAYLWKSVKEFVDKREPGSIILEVGCGNGKNMFRNDCYFIGLDNSIELLKICNKRDKNVVFASMISIPFKENTFDSTLCIASLHHISQYNDRVAILQKLVDITKINGEILLEVWSDEAKIKNKKTDLGNNDFLIEWNDTAKNSYLRYYHLFSKNEITNLLSKINNIKINSLVFEKDNWVAIIEKVS